jgi:hypothetical protein
MDRNREALKLKGQIVVHIGQISSDERGILTDDDITPLLTQDDTSLFCFPTKKYWTRQLIGEILIDNLLFE